MKLSFKLLTLCCLLSKLSAASALAPINVQDHNVSTTHKTVTRVASMDTEDAFLRKLFNSRCSSKTAHASAARYALKNLFTYSPESLHLIGKLLLKANQFLSARVCLERFIETSTSTTNPAHVLETAKFFHKHAPVLAAKGYQLVIKCKSASVEQRHEAQKSLDTLANPTR